MPTSVHSESSVPPPSPLCTGFASCTRRAAVGTLAAVIVGGTVPGCGRRRTSSAPPTREVVVYCSADAPVAQGVFDAFTLNTGIRVKPVYDTEATKTTGLVNRLLAEHQQGRAGPGACDVWWSSEPLGTIRLSRAGALEFYHSPASGTMARGWPIGLRGQAGDWYGFARRLRVVIYNTKHVAAEELPRFIRELGAEKWRGRVGMARPQFGTTRGHMAAIHSLDDGNALRTWLTRMKANDLRLFDGNASVARAAGSGEIWLGLTDSDDAINAMRNGWPVDFVPVGDVPVEPWAIRQPMTAVTTDNERGAAYPESPMQPPSTVALVKGGANAAEARALIDFLISDLAEKLLWESDFHALPTRPDRTVPGAEQNLGAWSRTAAARLPGLPRNLAHSDLDYERVAEHVDGAMKVCDEILGR